MNISIHIIINGDFRNPSTGWTPLLLAACRGHAAAVKV